MSLTHLFKYGVTLPPHIALRKALGFLKRRLTGKWQARANDSKTTYPLAIVGGDASENSSAKFNPLFRSQHDASVLGALAKKTMSHEFDLLGSGWLNVDIPDGKHVATTSTGNTARAREISDLIDQDYRRIDWHLDFRSGYRWSSNQRSESVLYGHEPGVDIKVPWELTRLQHLPQLALAHLPGLLQQSNPSEPNQYSAEFRNQVLDFMSANPPGYGVNWVCTMDVAIRAANMIVTFDLFRAQKIDFDAAFIIEFIAAMRAHGTHITQNLEWQDSFTGNHYLADITGLLFVASFLPRSSETDCWMAFAVQQFINETKTQFFADGSNVEASTNYHRLSAEMALYGTALIMGLSDDKQAALREFNPGNWKGVQPLQPGPISWQENIGPFTKAHFESLKRMAQFTCDVTKPNRHVVQIGDNDNGRMFKLSPAMRSESLDEDYLDHSHLMASIGSLLDDQTLVDQAGSRHKIESEFVRCLSGQKTVSVAEPNVGPHIDALPDHQTTASIGRCNRLIIDAETSVSTNELEALSYPDFGLFIWRSETFFLSVRCGPVGQGGNGGHAHNDQLSFELQINGEDWIADPGSYTYTADPIARDRYRSHLAHSGPRLELKEPSRLNLGLFRLEDNADAQCLVFNRSEFLGVHFGYKTPVYRHITISPQAIVITDSLGGWAREPVTITETNVDNASDLRDHFDLTVPFSRGYGISDTGFETKN